MPSKIVLGFGDPPSRLLVEIHRQLQLENIQLQYRFQPISLAFSALERSFGILQSEDLLGCHFAAPLQASQAVWLDRIGPGASSSGRINVIYKEGRYLIGEDTHLSGSLRALQSAGFRIEGSRVLLLGSGYEAQSIARSLAELGMKELLLLHNSVDRVRAMASALKREAPELIVMIGSLLTENFRELVGNVDLLINALPVGVDGSPNTWPGTLDLPRHLLVFDLIAESSLDSRNRQQIGEARYIDSSVLMLWQNAEIFRLWNGQDPPLPLLTKVISDAENHSH